MHSMLILSNFTECCLICFVSTPPKNSGSSLWSYLWIFSIPQTPFASTGESGKALRPILSLLKTNIRGQVEIRNAASFTGRSISRCSKCYPTMLICGPSDLLCQTWNPLKMWLKMRTFRTHLSPSRTSSTCSWDSCFFLILPFTLSLFESTILREASEQAFSIRLQKDSISAVRRGTYILDISPDCNPCILTEHSLYLRYHYPDLLHVPPASWSLPGHAWG